MARLHEEDLPLKVVVLTSIHDYLDTRVFHKECVSLVKLGHEVTLIAPLDGDFVEKGVRVRGVGRPGGRLERLLRTVPSIYKAAKAEEGDVYHFHSFELIPAARLLKRMPALVVYDAHEDTPKDLMTKEWLPRVIRRPLSWAAAALTRWASRFVDAIVVGEESRVAIWPKAKTHVIGNYPLPDEMRARPEYHGRPRNICYVGDIRAIRGAREMVAAMSKLNGHPGSKLILIGRIGDGELHDELKGSPGWERVDYRGWQERSGVNEALDSASVGLVVLHPEPNMTDAQPTKLFEYMAAGIPAIVSDVPLWRQIVEANGCGLVVDPFDVDAIRDAISYLLEHPDEAASMGLRGRKAAEERYNWTAEEEKLGRLYEELKRRISK